ncbi:MAG: hypothetical protein KC912_21285 [Proteobacteria bacterium]|nr:hypothetical protein [Pseudomonadota bacterium]
MTTRRLLAALALLGLGLSVVLMLPADPDAAEAPSAAVSPVSRPTSPAASPAPARAFPERPDSPATEVLHSLEAGLGRSHVACEVPAWLDAVDYPALRPGWVHEGILHAFVDGSGQRTLTRQPRVELSFTVEEVLAAQKDPELQTAILDEFRAQGDPKSQAPRVIGALEWSAESGQCALHPASELVPLEVRVEDAAGQSRNAFVRAGETGGRTAAGQVQFQVIRDSTVVLTASGQEGQASRTISASENEEVVLVLGDTDLPELAGAPEWTTAITEATAGKDAEGKALLASFQTFIQHGSADPMADALSDLLRVPVDEKSR